MQQFRANLALNGRGPHQAFAHASQWYVQFWTSQALAMEVSVVRGDAEAATGCFELPMGNELWAVMVPDGTPIEMSALRADGLVRQADDYWRRWLSDLQYAGRRVNVRRSVC